MNILIYLLLIISFSANADPVEILNVSYDPTREFYEDYNKAFSAFWKREKGDDVKIKQSHGGSGKQARAVIDGLDADVVSLALQYDIDQIHSKAKLLSSDWRQRLQHNSAPYTSTIVFLVRKGNPKNIHDWSDLINPDISVITPNPKTSGGARWNFLAAWEYAKKAYGSEEKAKQFLARLFENVPLLDSGARGSTISFAERQIGDVLITWENEAFLAQREYASDGLEVVVPSLSILAEPPVAVLDSVTSRHGTAEVAKAYVEYLFSDEGQEIAAKHHFRPRNQKILSKYSGFFPNVKLFTVSEAFGSWDEAQAKFFNDGGIFDQIYLKK